MFTQRLTQALLSAVATLLLLTTTGQSALLGDDLQATATPALTASALTTQLNNGSLEEPVVQRSHRPCGSEHGNYCENDGQCMYPQDNAQPSCICKPPYSGTRCHFFSDITFKKPGAEQVIAVVAGVSMLILALAIICCLVYKRFRKSASPIKSAPV